MLVNTQEFRREALHFKKHGYYTNAVPGTPPWEQYWDEQRRRCLEGYSVGDTRITGNHYYYLNFYQILRVKETESITGQRGQKQKIEDFPAFWDGDYNFWWALEIAQHGIDPEDYKKLNLGVNIKDLSGGMNMVILKARGKGFSYKFGSLGAQEFNLGEKTKVYGMADLEEYLIKDGLLNKMWDGIDFAAKYTAWGQPRLIDLMMHKKSGYKVRRKSGFVAEGTQNEIIGVTFRNDPNKARGKRGKWILWEEGGKFGSLKKAWDIAEDSIRAGKYATGCQVAWGTGGSEEQDFEDLSLLYYEPEYHNVLPFENIWDEGYVGSAAYFVPAYQNLEGFMDEDGNSDEEASKQYLNDIRDMKKKSGDPRSYDQYVAENPFNPQEAMLQTSTNLFPAREILDQYNYVKAHSLNMKMASHGYLSHDPSDGLLKFTPHGDSKPIINFPHRKDDDLDGCISIYEPPVRIEGRIPNNLYFICHDPYDHDSSTTMESLGAAFVIKVTSRYSLTFNECIVASYVGRPPSQDEYNQNLFNLAEYYNAKIGFENDRGNVIQYARTQKKLHMLEEEFEMLYKKELASSNVKRNYGMHMTPKRSEQGEIYIRDWLNTIITNYEDGRKKKVLHYIYDLALLQELLKFRQGGNFDRVKALMVGMYHQKEIFHKEVNTGPSNKHREFFERELFV